MSYGNRSHRIRRCIAGCSAPVVARCQHRLQREHAVCGVGLCERHVGPGTRCPTHAGTVERECRGAGVPLRSALALAAGEVYCAGCRVVVPVVDGRVGAHGRAG